MCAGFQEAIDGGGAAGSYGTVQSSRAVFVGGVDLCARFDQNFQRFDLLIRVEERIAGVAVGGVVKGAALAVVMRGVYVCAGFEKLADDLAAMAGGGEVEGGVFGVEPVEDLGLVEAGFIDQHHGKLRSTL